MRQLVFFAVVLVVAGSYAARPRVEGRFVDFVVDTGASLVVLRESSAALAGIRMSPRDYTATTDRQRQDKGRARQD
jgi:predicted aspartyl protease